MLKGCGVMMIDLIDLMELVEIKEIGRAASDEESYRMIIHSDTGDVSQILKKG